MAVNEDEPVQTKGVEVEDADKAADDAPGADKRGHARKDELLDEGVEETFPASDPVAVKHIT